MIWLDRAAVAILFLLGCVHNFIAAPMSYQSLSAPALWFVTGGISLWFAAIINFLWLRARWRSYRQSGGNAGEPYFLDVRAHFRFRDAKLGRPAKSASADARGLAHGAFHSSSFYGRRVAVIAGVGLNRVLLGQGPGATSGA